MRRPTVVLLACMLCATLTAAPQNGNDLYQQGLARETAGDLKGAIEIFERIVRDHPGNRTLTARALVQLGRWSDLLGQDQARKHYERVIREFADQKEAAAEARTRLDALAPAPPPTASPARRMVIDWKGVVEERTKVLRDGRHRLRYNGQNRSFEMVDIVTDGVRRLTSDGPNPEQSVVLRSQELSTDGRKIAAAVQILKAPAEVPALRDILRTELRVFDVDGRGPGRILATWDEQALGGWQQPFAWSPKDDRIWLFGTRTDQSAQIASVNMTGRLEVLKTLTWRESVQFPSLSPDGRFIAYHDAAGRLMPSDLHIIATDGSREHHVDDPADDTKPVFLPDGTGLVFVSNRRNSQDLWFVPVADGRPAGPPRMVWRDVEPFGQVETFSATGSLFFRVGGQDWGTYTVPINLEGPTGIGDATRLPTINGEVNNAADFSPDGRYLSYFRGGRLVLRELATASEQEISLGATMLSPTGVQVEWCPSGDAILAAGYVTGSGLGAFRVNVNDRSVQRLPFTPTNAYFPVLCLGDGREEIIYPAFKGNPWVVPGPIIRRSLVSGQETVLYKEAQAPLVRSMDGDRLAFVTAEPNGSSRFRLVTMSARGGPVSADLVPPDIKRRINAQIQGAAWMPGGDRIIISLRDAPDSYNWTQMSQTPFSLWVVPVADAASRRLGSVPLRTVEGRFFGVSGLSVRPDGKMLAYQVDEGAFQQTWVIENLVQFIKAGGGK